MDLELRYTRFTETIWSLNQADRNTFHYFQVWYRHPSTSLKMPQTRKVQKHQNQLPYFQEHFPFHFVLACVSLSSLCMLKATLFNFSICRFMVFISSSRFALVFSSSMMMSSFCFTIFSSLTIATMYLNSHHFHLRQWFCLSDLLFNLFENKLQSIFDSFCYPVTVWDEEVSSNPWLMTCLSCVGSPLGYTSCFMIHLGQRLITKK